MIGVGNSYHEICHVTNFEDIGIVARAVNRKLTTGLDVETYQIIIASY